MRQVRQQNTPSVEENRAVETLAAFFQGLFPQVLPSKTTVQAVVAVVVVAMSLISDKTLNQSRNHDINVLYALMMAYF